MNQFKILSVNSGLTPKEIQLMEKVEKVFWEKVEALLKLQQHKIESDKVIFELSERIKELEHVAETHK